MYNKIFTVRDALLMISDNVSHYESFNKADKYIVWAEDTENNSVGGDNKKQMQTIQGTIDYYTKEDGDETVDKIQEALEKGKIPFYLNSVQYENETGYIHFEWVWSVS